ncbi:hypothetical protein O6A27_05415 [Escherichia coli]|nr:hypothetical protein [Escherichia coli]
MIESGLWSRDAVERQMSHQERNGVRAAYIHKAEHLEERRLMLQWWADFLDANREKVSARLNMQRLTNPVKIVIIGLPARNYFQYFFFEINE